MKISLITFKCLVFDVGGIEEAGEWARTKRRKRRK